MPHKPKSHLQLVREKNSGIVSASGRRPNPRDRGYDTRWEHSRKWFLAQHPTCIMCERRGVVRLATCVDHIIPHRGNMKLFWDASNLQSLCTEHHSEKTRAGL